MRKLVAAAVAALILVGLAPVASHAVTGSHQAGRLAPGLADRLESSAPGERLLVLVHGTSRAAAVAAVAHAGLGQLLVLESIGVPAAIGTVAQVRDLVDESGVTYVEQDASIELFSDTATVATRAVEAREIFVDEAGNPLYTGAGRSIAIVDGGIDGTHPMFQRADGSSKVVRNLKVACHDAVCPPGEESDPFMIDLTDKGNDSDTPSGGGHGTHVASIAAGQQVTTADGRKLSGTAPGADLVGISVGETLSIFAADIALDWIARNHENPCESADATCNPITVVNNSYGPAGGGEFDPNSATALITERLVADGIVVVWANGNGDATNDGGTGEDNRSNPEGQNPLPGVLSVANYDDGGTGTRDGTLDSSSSRGKATDASSWPDLSAPGANITAACRPYLAICTSGETDPNYGTISGTSMASPHVVGVVALLQEAKPGITPAEIEDALEDTAHPFAFGGDYGADPTNATTPSSFDKGHGLVDVTNALHRILGQEPTAGATSACAPGTPLVTDPEGDATMVASADGGEDFYEASLDVTTVEVSGDPATEVLTVVLHVADLAEAEPAGTSGISFEGTLSIGSDAYDLGAERTAGMASFTFGDAAVDGAFDATTDTVTWLIPRSAIGDHAGQVTVKALSAGYSRRSYKPTPLGPVSDDFAGTCSTTVDVGGVAVPETPPAEPEGTASPGAPYTFTGEPSTAVSDPTGLDLTSVTVTGAHEATHVIDVVVPAGGTVTFDLTCGKPDVDDFDITLSGPDGSSAGSSAEAGCVEQIVVNDAAPGVDTLTVETFAAVEGVYEGTVTVS